MDEDSLAEAIRIFRYFNWGKSINILFQRLRSAWTKRFGDEVEEDLLHYLAVERILQIEDFKEVQLIFCH